MKPLPIRLRLTLWYFVMFAVAALLLSLSSWWMLRRTLDATVRQDLQERIDDVSTQLHQFGAKADPQQAQTQFANFYRDRDDGKWLQILDQDGRWIYRSARMTSSGLALLPPSPLMRAVCCYRFYSGHSQCPRAVHPGRRRWARVHRADRHFSAQTPCPAA
jgi:hypothetical protein